jgi:hypothetical protein
MQHRCTRAALILLSAVALQAARKDFWETKDPSSWSPQEKETILFRSPWARDCVARIEFEKQERPAGPGYTSDGRIDPGMPDAKPSAGPGMGGRGVPIGQPIPPVPKPTPGSPVQFQVLARWETAKPVQLAGAPEPPDSGGQFYIIRLSGLPLMPPPKVQPGEPTIDPNEDMLSAIKQGSRLEFRDKPPIRCTHLFMGTGEHAREVLLFFPRGSGSLITPADKMVTLDVRFAPFHLWVKFTLKEMTYKGELSL